MEHPRGFDRQTLKIVEGWDYVRSLLEDALSTRIGSRVLRRYYGSNIPAYIDAPSTSPVILSLLADAAEAADAIRNLETGEAVVQFEQSGKVEVNRKGNLYLDLYFLYLVDGTRRSFTIGDGLINKLNAGTA